MNTKAPNRKSLTSHLLTVGVILAILISGYSLYRVITLKPGEKTTIVPGVTVTKPSKSVQDTYVSDKNELIVVYNDGSTRNLGSYKGRDGVDAIISHVDVQQAVRNYCANGRCDAKTPTPDVVLASVLEACGGNCRGANGKDAKPVTDDQILAQVANFCADGRCRGEAGAAGANGINGLNGRTPHLACVLVKENNTDVRYYSAKYTDEPDAAYLTWQYRSKLPAWFQPSDCIDMRG